MDEDLSREAGERIRAARQRRHISQIALADELGLGRNSIRGIEANAFGSKIVVLRRVCEYLELDPNYVLGLTPRSYVDDLGAIYKVTTDLLLEDKED